MHSHKQIPRCQFIGGKLEIQGQRTKSRSERQVELEDEYDKMVTEFGNFDYELKPIPIPVEAQASGTLQVAIANGRPHVPVVPL